ncbi:MAG: protoheme IX farnesyltransferase [Candidatus Hydrogenedentes bacterium]|nr:protoheme IX farnesyltransferase [Candidatus Hydrogenedentota bacterium]MBI3118820.1 protoheme IX farnesyltransferase [Candidatus Hydrogenedentota bacterium]
MAASVFRPYVELTKPRIMTMVLVTTTLGFALGGGNGIQPIDLLLFTLIGTGFASAGAGVLNHYLERDVDALMDRTRNRPLPMGLVRPWVALLYGGLLIIAGGAVLYFRANALAAALALSSALLYVLIYTPMKKVTWLNTPIGAVPGALPPMIGWAAVSGRLELGAWVLFFILFLWQHPHFYAIAWMFRDDYVRGGFKMLPVVQPDGKSTFRQSLSAALILIPVSLWPTFVRMTGWFYFFGALVIGFWFLAACVRWRVSESTLDARKVLRVSVIYLPVLLLLILVDSYLK